MKTDYKDIDHYISTFPDDVQEILEGLRAFIQKNAPEAKEKISYQIPTFDFYGNLVHFAAYKNHIGFYPGAKAIRVFQEELKGFKTSKGTVQFPIEKPLPLGLIGKIVKFRVKENSESGKRKAKA
ncbi:hypothetical protein EHQ27_00270 [Leptospira wolffii]|uniref:iron chaperone n=1 Tax=Leptospira wolffii TaxID=409998 RepID=UPI0003491524|nr:DUF1801 domain-containing protein [Leptospira wolffii]TGK59464.1 hypothetical protein EHQ32_11840 [Leptospira wolffii]TGK71153.1 hypothetical protein EHQ35_13505 [Leptospira wolffii]TGK77721.1 hypothetical protein EHQ27_00270 [Leptospira wolffii]TGL29569.1 hypothetical protein EHQ57_11650 [Leptospira wolffii]